MLALSFRDSAKKVRVRVRVRVRMRVCVRMRLRGRVRVREKAHATLDVLLSPAASPSYVLERIFPVFFDLRVDVCKDADFCHK